MRRFTICVCGRTLFALALAYELPVVGLWIGSRQWTWRLPI